MSGGGGGKGGGSQTTGYRYYFGIHMGLGRGPVDEIVQIKVGDKTAWQGFIRENADVAIDQYNLFGGEGKEGGIQGSLQVMMGESTQTASSGLLGMLGAPLPGFRRMVTAFFDGLVAMNNPYPKPWKFRMRRTLKGWDGPVFESGLARIVYGADSIKLPAPGLLLRFDGAPGSTTIVDEMGSVVSNTFVTIAGSPAKFGTSGYFNNLLNPAHVISVEQTDDRNVFGSGDFTIDAWVYPLSLAGNCTVIERRIATLPLDGTWRFSLTSFQHLGSGISSLSYTPPALNQWSLLSVSRVSGVVRIFVNGQKRAEGYFPFNFTTEQSIRVGRSDDGSTDHFKGYMDEVRLLKGVGLYVNDFDIPTAPFPTTATEAHLGSIVAMNPAHIIYECLTNREWGRGFDSSLLNTTSFTACAQALYDENFGLCLKWSRSDSIESFVQSVLDHIGATLFTSRRTGLITLKLIRNDYVQSELPLFDAESGLLRITESTVSAQGSGVNQVEVTYHDPLSDEDLVVKVDNIAAIQTSNGNVNKLSKQYTGLPTAALALRIAQRDLRAASTSLRRFTMVLDRRGRSIEPGSVIRIRDASRGIPETVVRVGRIDDGTITSGEITVTALQDVFALPVSSYGTSVENTWAPPNNTPCLDIHRVIEMPYFMVNRTTSAADLALIDPAAGFIGTMVAEGQSMNVGHKIAVRDSAPTAEDYPLATSQYCGFVPDWTP